MTKTVFTTLALALLTACGGGADSGADTQDPGSGGASGSGPTGSPGGTAGASTGGSNAAGSGGTASAPGGGGSAGSTSDGGASTGGSGAGGGPPTPVSLPEPTAPCPELVNGKVTFSPKGAGSRDVEIRIGPSAKQKAGPLIFYFHGLEGTPDGMSWVFGNAGIDAIVAAGGIIVAPYGDPSLPLAWGQPHLLLADEVVACALKSTKMDVRRIHATGMSAGGFHTVRMSYERSSYLASVVVMSAGLQGSPPPTQDPNNLFAALIFHGGATDLPAYGIVESAQKYRDDLESKGHFTLFCNHGKGHVVPTDAQSSVIAFLDAHPYGTNPSPFDSGLPSGFVSYCE